MLTYRTIGGILDFYIFMGPSLEEVVQQYAMVPTDHLNSFFHDFSFYKNKLLSIDTSIFMEWSIQERHFTRHCVVVQVIGTTYLPPYWSLGFHLSRYGYLDTSDMRAAVDRTLENNIPVVSSSGYSYLSRHQQSCYSTGKFEC